ncbi:hypothetical protein DNU06_17475 [Putridiphycobacter roseus]|uniref:Uncharacterized protein n=2 Tax=Putridiphycobacter roseus TaxID=2219161 RepID=A0A2W1MUS5_9FLAO|nr:hypothetical protein [Putridiphycobacter roseus]PZE15557.1 hypothetical protein DNU06_17475 [Putridiphycobacter roseus]
MKYNLTNESYHPDNISNMPNLASSSFWSIISASLYYNIVSIIISLVLYFPIVAGFKKLISKSIPRRILTGFVLTLTTPILHLISSDFKHNDYYQRSAELSAWILCFLISMTFYYIANMSTKDKY